MTQMQLGGFASAEKEAPQNDLCHIDSEPIKCSVRVANQAAVVNSSESDRS